MDPWNWVRFKYKMKGDTKQRHENLAFWVETYACGQNKWYASILARITLMISAEAQWHGIWEGTEL
jgi:hypothetical protein